MTTQPPETGIHAVVREHYGTLARQAEGGGGDCCSPLYPADQIIGLPDSVTNLSLGCGDPVTLADIRPGDTVVDLGSGGGIDCFMAARRTGPTGRVIGVDMTEAMLARARANAAKVNAANVEFREGFIEALPVADGEADVVISNCVINLSPDKPRVFREIFRALKPGGRLAVSDIVTDGALPQAIQDNPEAWSACVAGALDAQDYRAGLEAAGFVEVKVQPKAEFDVGQAPVLAHAPFSALITARKG